MSLRVRCWFCGKCAPWFSCDCPTAREAQQGKREKPKFTRTPDGVLVVYLDDEAARLNLAGLPVYRKAVHVVNTEVVHAAEIVHVAVHAPADDVHADRRAYRAEWMRRKRQQDREAGA